MLSPIAGVQEAIEAMSDNGGAPPCDPVNQKLAAKAVKEFEDKVRRRVHRLTASRTGARIPYNRVHLDTRSCDTYQRLMCVVMQAAIEYDPTAGMSWEGWITWRLFHTDADSSFFESPLTVPYTTAMDYLSAKKSSTDVEAQRDYWEGLGRDPLDFDTISASLVEDPEPQSSTPGPFAGENPPSDNQAAHVACSDPMPDLQAEARLFLTNDLTELEAMVWKYHARYGYTFKRIGEDLLPAHLFDNSGNAEHKVRRIYLKAQAKAQDFLNTDGSEL